jgi:hypothetical protein
MQEEDVLEFGYLLARAIGTALLVVTDEVSEVAGAVRRGSKDYLRHLVGTSAGRRGYFGESDMDLDADFAGEGIGETLEWGLAGAMDRGHLRDEAIRVGSGFDGCAEEVDFEVLLDFFTRDLRGR